MIAPVMPTYARAPLEFERGEGSWLISTDGEKYLDFGAGIAVNCLGHAHPKLIEALEGQARRLWHTSNLYQITGQSLLAEKLVEQTFGDTVFFTNSGAEAMEMSIKMARKYWSAKGEDRYRIITFEGCFHGRTLATVSSAATNPKLVDGFGPLLDGFDILPFGDHDALREYAARPETAAILLEPVQGEGGIRPIPHQCQRGVRELCDEHGLLMMLDEVQSGAGRTGKLFAHENAGYTPDIMGIAKGIGGGFPMGACVATANAASGMTAGTHGSTYGGNPLAMAVGNAVLDELTAPGFLDDVARKAGFLRQRLAELADTHSDLIEEVRGEGLMIGIKFRETAPVGDAVGAAYAQKMLTVPAGDNTMRILPPLNVSEADLGEAVNRLDAACQALKS